jgi:hypothetical protein
MALTVLSIKNAQPQAKAYKLSDERSLFLLVMLNGAKYWRVRYRFLGRQKTLALGIWPKVGLAEVREKSDAARKLVDDGRDPGAEKKLRKIRAQFDANTSFKAVAEEWITKITREGRAGVTLDKVQWLLGKAYRLIGDRPVNQIEALEVLAILRKLEATGRYESARRMRSVISRVLRYGIATGRAQRDVAADLRGAIVVPKTKNYAAITSPKAVGELRKAEWAEFDFGRAVWSIPADKMKMRWPHQVPSFDPVKMERIIHKKCERSDTQRASTAVHRYQSHRLRLRLSTVSR